jgi:hypothetical protein
MQAWHASAPRGDAACPGEMGRPVGIRVVQVLWDRGEKHGYVQHLVDDTLEGVPAKSLALTETFGDHQVANVSAKMLARTRHGGAPGPDRPGKQHRCEAPVWHRPLWLELLDSWGRALVVRCRDSGPADRKAGFVVTNCQLRVLTVSSPPLQTARTSSGAECDLAVDRYSSALGGVSKLE